MRHQKGLLAGSAVLSGAEALDTYICGRGHGLFEPNQALTRWDIVTDDVHAARYLLTTPLVGDYLEEGLSQLGHSLDDAEVNRL